MEFFYDTSRGLGSFAVARRTDSRGDIIEYLCEDTVGEIFRKLVVVGGENRRNGGEDARCYYHAICRYFSHVLVHQKGKNYLFYTQ